ncbi:16S rRNA (cytosine(1402)-N(4))-methyltransferase RsmH [Candidatus Peregrinibacteria bacterium]|nr:16S rRNA (cytosine(1402)-N(4))-methyltransferase RsmH [Candidatus Peregrinibacteria bacterium]
MQPFSHTPVLLEETLALLNLRTDIKVIDGTVGLGGHSKEILKKIGSRGKLLAIDQDAENLKKAQETLSDYKKQINWVYGNFDQLEAHVKGSRFGSVDAILLDLGLSSPHVDDPRRGFSFRKEGPLDMRFDQSSDLTAADIINRFNERELAKIFFEFGEERRSRQMARKIVLARKKKRFETTRDLASLFEHEKKGKPLFHKIHPATRIFQALRMAVNHELESLENALHQAIKILATGGRLGVISYHSLEDRLIKNIFRYYAQKCICPKEIHICQCNFKKTLYLITKKPIIPSGIEVSTNPRARSAKLRVVEKIYS